MSNNGNLENLDSTSDAVAAEIPVDSTLNDQETISNDLIAFTSLYGVPAKIKAIRQDYEWLRQKFPENNFGSFGYYLPKQILTALGVELPATETLPVFMQDMPPINSPEDLKTFILKLGRLFFADDLVAKYFTLDSDQLCMNLTAILLKLLDRCLKLPIVGLESQPGEGDYIRPLVMVMDSIRDPRDSGHQNNEERYSLEVALEISFQGKVFLVDFNYYYREPDKWQHQTAQRDLTNLAPDYPVLLLDITESRLDKDLADAYGLYLPPELAGAYFPENIREYYLDEEAISSIFNLYIGNPRSLKAVQSRMHHLVTCSPQYYALNLSDLALISQGAEARDLAGGTSRQHIIIGEDGSMEKSSISSLKNLAMLTDPALT